jgi:hypothetical protein
MCTQSLHIVKINRSQKREGRKIIYGGQCYIESLGRVGTGGHSFSYKRYFRQVIRSFIMAAGWNLNQCIDLAYNGR